MNIFTKTSKKAISAFLVIILAFAATFTVFAKDFSIYERIKQPVFSYSFSKNTVAAVNFHPTWGDKDANLASMKEYIEQAKSSGVKILVFPEMCVTGYVSTDDEASEYYQMAINLSETKDGFVASEISALAASYKMWIVYGASETIPNDNEHAYNSAFICSPDGKITTYQKICPAEGSWCKAGETPILISDDKYGMIGVSLGSDILEYPEIGRYYSAKGCNIILCPTASARNYDGKYNDGLKEALGWEWYYKNRIESNTSRDGYTLVCANLLGSDKNNIYSFPGGSVIVNNGQSYYAGYSNSRILTQSEGLVKNTSSFTAVTGSTCNNKDFTPENYTLWYDTLADMQNGGASLIYDSNISDGPTAAVANINASWGNKTANINKIESYITKAAENNVDILVFPETILTGYCCEDFISDPFYRNSGKLMHVSLAETIPGPTTEFFSEYAKKYNMYIIIGMSEKTSSPIYDTTDGNFEKVYNSAAILFPDGRIESYRKIHRAGNESDWSVCGDTPLIFNTPWGKVGIDICRDGHFYPEVARYYAAMGCTIFIHPTATTGNPWYRETRIGSYTDRDGLAAISCNILGTDGIYNSSQNRWSGGRFASTSLIITKQLDENENESFNRETGYAINLNNTGSASEGFDTRGTSPEGLEIAKMNLSRCGFKQQVFPARLFSKMYDELAVLYRKEYKSIYEKKGDATGDTEIDIEDATFIQKVLAGLEADNGRCDVDNDDYTSILDATLIQKYIAQLVDTLE